MKKALLFFFAFGLLCPVSCFGQILDSLRIEYSNPGINNNVEVIAFLTIGSAPTWRISYSSTISNDTLYLSSCYYSGVLTAMSYLTDTLRVGTIPPTVRGLHFRIYAASNPNTCDTSLFIKSIYPFQVLNPTGILAGKQYPKTEIYPNPVSDVIHVTGQHVTQLNLFDLRGRLIKRYDLVAQKSTKISVSDLPEGLYVAELISRNGEIFRKRLVKH